MQATCVPPAYIKASEPLQCALPHYWSNALTIEEKKVVQLKRQPRLPSSPRTEILQLQRFAPPQQEPAYANGQQGHGSRFGHCDRNGVKLQEAGVVAEIERQGRGRGGSQRREVQ